MTLCDCPICVARVGHALACETTGVRLEVSQKIAAAMIEAISDGTTMPELVAAVSGMLVGLAMENMPEQPKALGAAVAMVVVNMLDQQMTPAEGEAVH